MIWRSASELVYLIEATGFHDYVQPSFGRRPSVVLQCFFEPLHIVVSFDVSTCVWCSFAVVALEGDVGQFYQELEPDVSDHLQCVLSVSLCSPAVFPDSLGGRTRDAMCQVCVRALVFQFLS